MFNGIFNPFKQRLFLSFFVFIKGCRALVPRRHRFVPCANPGVKVAFFPQMRPSFAKSLTFLWLIAALSIFWGACGSDSKRDTPDVSHLPDAVHIQRFDQDLFALDTAHLQEGMQQMAQKYPDLFTLFTVNIIHDQTNPKETPDQALRNFLGSPYVRKLNDTVQQVYRDLKPVEKELGRMFQYYQYYFPKKPVPTVAAIVSEFATDAFTAGDNLCGIGLDLYLGENYQGYDPQLFPGYIRRQFHRDYIPVRLAKALAQNLAGDPVGDRLIDQMAYHGKVLYIVDCLLPDTPDSLKMGYTTAQLEGCQANEQLAWGTLIDKKLLYSTDYGTYQKLVTPSPNAPVLFQEAPGEVGSWLGWQIVKAYMKRYPKTPMEKLLAITDGQVLLEQAKYKPGR